MGKNFIAHGWYHWKFSYQSSVITISISVYNKVYSNITTLHALLLTLEAIHGCKNSLKYSLEANKAINKLSIRKREQSHSVHRLHEFIDRNPILVTFYQPLKCNILSCVCVKQRQKNAKQKFLTPFNFVTLPFDRKN